MDLNTPAALQATHELYCQLTGQKLSLRFDRERLWYEFLRAGFSTQDLKRVIAYLQKEIRASRRNVGAQKLSNLLQLDPVKTAVIPTANKAQKAFLFIMVCPSMRRLSSLDLQDIIY